MKYVKAKIFSDFLENLGLGEVVGEIFKVVLIIAAVGLFLYWIFKDD